MNQVLVMNDSRSTLTRFSFPIKVKQAYKLCFFSKTGKLNNRLNFRNYNGARFSVLQVLGIRLFVFFNHKFFLFSFLKLAF